MGCPGCDILLLSPVISSWSVSVTLGMCVYVMRGTVEPLGGVTQGGVHELCELSLEKTLHKEIQACRKVTALSSCSQIFLTLFWPPMPSVAGECWGSDCHSERDSHAPPGSVC
jgi:hypothetical protein